jgi:hypothetical protein
VILEIVWRSGSFLKEGVAGLCDEHIIQEAFENIHYEVADWIWFQDWKI